VCGRPLTSPASIAEQAGPVCAVRVTQVPIDFEAEPWAEGVAPAALPWIRAARADAAAKGRVPTPGCPGCELYGGTCGLHAPRGTAVPTTVVRPPVPLRDLSRLPPAGPPPPSGVRAAGSRA
jgi:hypothetical protein